MSQRTLPASIAAGMAITRVATLPHATAATFNLADIPWPSNAEFVTGPDVSQFTNADRATSDPYTLSQTFGVDNAFDANNEVHGTRVVGQVLFDNPVTLSPTTGSAGYAIRFIDLDGATEWRA
ncbi:MAG: hypothetical protein AAGJ46_11090 [Planctomycetota bacterium]